jgi:hypothetical protein
MFYHASLLFDYKGFASEANQLAHAVNQNNLAPLQKKADSLAKILWRESYILQDYGDPLYIPQPIKDVQTSLHKNRFIGDWFMIVMAQYVEPQPKHIGYNWRILETILQELNWNKEEIRLLFWGLPVGTLITQRDMTDYPETLVDSDPYWMWIRPDYSYGRSGWLSLEECIRLRVNLQEIGPAIRQYRARDETLTDLQKRQWEERLHSGYNDAIDMLDVAIRASKGLYLVVLWQWEDEEE